MTQPYPKKLEPCPFCGGEVELIEAIKPWVRCRNENCYHFRYDGRMFGSKEARETTIKEWNTRHTKTTPSVEQLATFLRDYRGGHPGFPPASWDVQEAQAIHDFLNKKEG